MIYAIEKRSVHKVREALKPGGIVVVVAGHISASGASLEYASNELLKIFEEPITICDWCKEPIRVVRLIAEKPR